MKWDYHNTEKKKENTIATIRNYTTRTHSIRASLSSGSDCDEPSHKSRIVESIKVATSYRDLAHPQNPLCSYKFLNVLTLLTCKIAQTPLTPDKAPVNAFIMDNSAR